MAMVWLVEQVFSALYCIVSRVPKGGENKEENYGEYYCEEGRAEQDTKDVFSRPVDVTTQQKVGKTKEVMLPAKYQCPKMFRLTVIYPVEHPISEV